MHAFWYSVLHETESLCRLIRNKRVSVAEWRRQQLVRTHEQADLLSLGFATFFLNRTNRSGIVCSGGMIGGRAQSGVWTLAARYNKPALMQRVELIASRKNSISIYKEDAANLLVDLGAKLPAKTLWYLDPPYYVKGQRRLYANFYQHADHAEVASLVKSTVANWVVTYDDTKAVRDLYRDCPMRRYNIAYSAHDAYQGER
ncbi:MAG: DNA adenine methylase [Sandaracinaceae bacterium]|nr:DNA adenine methylase [Sandaracinaceae bacterium]